MSVVKSSSSSAWRTVALVGMTAVAALCCYALIDELWHQLDPHMPAMRHTTILGVPFDTARFNLPDALHADLTLVVIAILLVVATTAGWLSRFRRA